MPFYESFDLERNGSFTLLAIYRLIQALFLTKMLYHPDELYQGTQVAYNMVYGDVDLPWEWKDPYRLRNTLYPFYLSLPLWLLKWTRLDFNYLVIASPYLAHWPLMIISDCYLWRIGIKLCGKSETRIAFILMLTNGFLAELDPRCFTNTLEKVCTLVAFYLYIHQKTQFDRETFKFVVLLTIGFMMRNTFPIGWIPLLLVLVVKADKPVIYIIQCVFTFLPFFVLFVAIDSIYYWKANGGKLEVTFTGYNFLKVNVLQGLSKYFGVSSFFTYVAEFFPVEIFRLFYPVVIYSFTQLFFT